MRLICITFLTLALLSGCSVAENQRSIERTGLPGEFFNTEWQLAKATQADASTDDRIPMIIFGWEENRVFGSDGCNRFSGAYLPGEGNTLTFDGIVSTRMACADQNSAVPFSEKLRETAGYRFNEDFTVLFLLDTNGNRLLAFNKTVLKRI
jgi:heat shock protein HslJ